jgi:hypothetical protein
MSKENFDDLAMFCGDKDFYDLDGDGHLDDFEAAMMIGDVADELEEIQRTPPLRYTSAPCKTTQSSAKIGIFWPVIILSTILWVWELIDDANHGITDLDGTIGGIIFLIVLCVLHHVWVSIRKN